jgi:endonuclease/exonuclease/phosphatase family metal-dependent hydrolase
MSSNENSKHDRTAKDIAEHCYNKKKENGKNMCLENVLNVINNNTYDIIALQETVNWEYLYDNSSINSKAFINTSIQSNIGPYVNLTTFYNSCRFDLKRVYFGNIANDMKDIRPFQIILFNDKRTNKLFYFINLHNGHKVAKEDLQRIITRSSLFVVPDTKSVDIQVPYNETSEKILFNYDLDSIISIKSDTGPQKSTEPVGEKIYYKEVYPIIMVGDFNDHGKHNYYRGLVVNTKTVTNQGSTPPISCCTGKTTGIRSSTFNTDDKYGDYILISDDFRFITNSQIVPGFNIDASEFPTSDHLPVEAVIGYGRSSGGKKYKKSLKRTRKK